MDLSKLSANKLAAEITKRSGIALVACDATIAAGLGQIRFNDMVEMAKGDDKNAKLARHYVDAQRAHTIAIHERDARRRYHGGDHPISRRA